MNSEQQYIDLFNQCRGMLDKYSSRVMNSPRAEAFENFVRLGLPDKKVERYKYTDMQSLFAPDYGLNLNRLEIPVNPYDAFRCDVPNLSTSLYFMVNDTFYTKIMPTVSLPEGVLVCSLKEASDKYPSLVEKYYGKLADTAKDAVNAFNTMFAQDGLFIFVPRGIVVDRPIQIVNILRSDVDLMVNRRVLVVMEQNSQARILVCDHASDDRNFLTTQVAEVFVGENAHLDIYDLEETHVKNRRVSNVYVNQSGSSVFSMHCHTLHNGLTRNMTEVYLSGEGAETSLYGCVVADKEQHVDNNTLIEHRVPYCVSHELYKYVLDDKSTGAFAGKILVKEGAHHTVSEETNANLCATREARMWTQPMLEIYDDDVKCSHGSTVGQLNEQALFYMRQRGISLDEAQMLLKFAFAGEVIDSISLEALKDRLHHLMEKRFKGELSKCSGCNLCR